MTRLVIFSIHLARGDREMFTNIYRENARNDSFLSSAILPTDDQIGANAEENNHERIEVQHVSKSWLQVT